MVQLTPSMITHAILLNVEQLVRKSHGPLKVKDLQAQYLQVYRNELSPEDFGVASLEALLLTMTDKLEVLAQTGPVRSHAHRRLVSLHGFGRGALDQRTEFRYVTTRQERGSDTDALAMPALLLAVEAGHARAIQTRPHVEHVPTGAPRLRRGELSVRPR